jgi:hypothetical protein
MMADTVEPYKGWDQKIPFVVDSNHPRFAEGTRLDWGFAQVALRDGYTLEIRP